MTTIGGDVTYTDPAMADLYAGVSESQALADNLRLARQMRGRQREAFLVANPEARGLDAFESTPEGCVTHSYACLCREARAREMWEAAMSVLESLKPLCDCGCDAAAWRLRAALDAWKPAMDEGESSGN